MPPSNPWFSVAIAWCLAWGDTSAPQHPDVIEALRQALPNKPPLSEADLADITWPEIVHPFLAHAQQLETLERPTTRAELVATIQQHPHLWNTQIGLVYGGATKIKQYVFEATKLPDIRGASALLDRINLFDLPVFFGQERSPTINDWLASQPQLQNLQNALIPPLIIYSTGGNLLAFCPVAYVNQLANAIERRYTDETLTANSCAVGASFRVLEVQLGLLKNPIEQTFWLDQYLSNPDHPLVAAYFDQQDITEPAEKFWSRKNFTELVTQLTGQYNQRRSGFDPVGSDRPSRRYPPMFETHPYLRRDDSDRRSAIAQINELGDRPWLSEALVRKRITGQIAKREVFQERLPPWFHNLGLNWQPTACRITSWVAEFEKFLNDSHNQALKASYCITQNLDNVEEARNLRELGNISQPSGFIAYIYADGNNMGGYIQKSVHTPQEHRQFSQDIFEAIQHAVFHALAQHLHPRQLSGLTDPDSRKREGHWVHPFEIITIGGDDVLLIVPADVALSVAHSIGEQFEYYLKIRGRYHSDKHYNPLEVHRYKKELPAYSQCTLSLSTGVLITAEDTPIYYADKLVGQLLKSAKKRAKELKKKGYLGGTIDFLTLKSVTMISDQIENFRQEGLTKTVKIKGGKQTLKQYAAPYTLHEINGLITTVKAIKQSRFPRSQLYQIRRLLDRGKQTAILNYRYFKVRLQSAANRQILTEAFEEPWCAAKTNGGNLAPWMSCSTTERTSYETIWRDLIDLYSFIQTDDDRDRPSQPSASPRSVEVTS